MSKVHIVVTTQPAKVGDDTFPRLNSVIVKSPALPLGEGEGDLEVGAREIARFEGGGSLDSVEVVVEAGGAGDEEGGGDTDQVEVGF